MRIGNVSLSFAASFLGLLIASILVVGCASRRYNEDRSQVRAASSTSNQAAGNPSCTLDSQAKDLEKSKKRFQRFVAGGCLVITLMGNLSSQAIANQGSQEYLSQFKTTCTSWNDAEEVTLLASPKISEELPEQVACKSPSHKRTFEDAGAGLNPARLFVTRVFFATLTGAGQFLPDPGTAIPSKYLHRYLAGIGGKKVISEPSLVEGLETIIRQKWTVLTAASAKPLAEAKFVVSYGDYDRLQQELIAMKGGGEFKPEGASSHHPLFNSLGSAEVRLRHFATLDSITDSPAAATKLENLSAIRKESEKGGTPPAGYLVVEINDPYSWPGAGGPADELGGYDQSLDGTSEGLDITGKAFPETAYPSNAFPELLVRTTRILLGAGGQSDRFTDLSIKTAADFPPELVDAGFVPKNFRQVSSGLKDSVFRAQLRAGAKDFMMVKHWIIPLSK